MRPTQIQIENFLSYENSGKVDINNKTIIVGENNAGKSNFVDALRTFFRFSSRRRQDLDNFHNRDEDKQIRITVWFELCDEEREEFDEGLDEPSTGELAVRLVSEYNSEEERAETNDYQRLTDSENDEWKKRTGLANTLDGLLPEVAHYDAERELDDAAKTSNKNSLLFRLLGSAYDDIPQEDKEALEKRRGELQEQLGEETPAPIEELVESLDKKMSSQVTMDGELNVGFDIPEVREMVQRHATVWTDDEQADEIADMGSGSQMSFVLSCIWETAEREKETEDDFITLEEPENHLHPHSVRQLHTAVNELAGDDDFIFLTTHSPELASPRDINNILRVEHSEGSSEITQVTDQIGDRDIQVLKTIESRGTSEMLFSRAVIICEGETDSDVLRIASQLLADSNERMQPFDSKAISVVDAGSKNNVPVYLRMAHEFSIPAVAVIDTDVLREDDDTDPKDVDVETIRECQKLSDEFQMLEEDLEHALFQEVSLEQFHKSMEQLSNLDLTDNYDQSLTGLNKWLKEHKDISKNEIMKELFDECDPPKPALGRELSRRCEVESFPDRLQGVVEKANELAD